MGLRPARWWVWMALAATVLLSVGACRHSKGEPVPDIATQAQRLGRGVNLGNALEAPNEGEWGMVIEAEYFPLIREAGFQTVRVPIRWSAHAATGEPYTINEAFFERVDWVIDQALDHDLNVVLDLHHYEELFVDPEGHGDRFVALWKQIAERYRDRPLEVYFELLNEPHGKLDAVRWNELLARTVTAVREIDTRHTLIVGGADWNSIDGLTFLALPPEEDNLIVTFHYYEPFLFTHQGANWVGPEIGTTGVVWPGPPPAEVTPIPAARKVEWVKMWFARYNQVSGSHNPASPEAIERDFDRAAQWGQSHEVPLWLGEFGAYSKADMGSRVRWTTAVRTAAEARGIGWAYWEFGAGFGVYDRQAGAWRTPLLEALIPPSDK